jgi:hypothetical protein
MPGLAAGLAAIAEPTAPSRDPQVQPVVNSSARDPSPAGDLRRAQASETHGESTDHVLLLMSHVRTHVRTVFGRYRVYTRRPLRLWWNW